MPPARKEHHPREVRRTEFVQRQLIRHQVHRVSRDAAVALIDAADARRLVFPAQRQNREVGRGSERVELRFGQQLGAAEISASAWVARSQCRALDVLVSWIRHNRAASAGVGWCAENVDRIEVAKRPMAVFVGGATLGGVVNLITKKPLFTSRHEATFRGASHETFGASIDSTGPISRALAYRVIAGYEDGNTWRNHSHSRTTFVDPQLLWRPNEKYTGRVEILWRER